MLLTLLTQYLPDEVIEASKSEVQKLKSQNATLRNELTTTTSQLADALDEVEVSACSAAAPHPTHVLPLAGGKCRVPGVVGRGHAGGRGVQSAL